MKEFKPEHQIDLVVEDKQKQQAIFITQSARTSMNDSGKRLIDTVTFLKLVVAADGKLT